MFGLVKVDLTQEEIDTRTQQVLELLKEQEQLAAQVMTLKSRAKMLQGQSDTKGLEISELRSEIELRYVWRDAQEQLPLDAPPEKPVSLYDLFESTYVVASDWSQLTDQLRDILSGDQYARFFTEEDEPIADWHPQSGIFRAVAHWARIELAHLESETFAKAGTPSTPGLTIPARVPMPEKLAELVVEKPAPKAKRARKAAAQ